MDDGNGSENADDNDADNDKSAAGKAYGKDDDANNKLKSYIDVSIYVLSVDMYITQASVLILNCQSRIH